MTTDRSGLVKVAVPLPKGRKFSVESMWAKPLVQGAFELQNVPFFAYDVSFGDVVKANADERNESLIFKNVIRRSGHSTFRVIPKNDAEFQKFWKAIEAAGCTYERATGRLIAIDVPAKVDLASVERLLESAQSAGAWQYEIGHKHE